MKLDAAMGDAEKQWNTVGEVLEEGIQDIFPKVRRNGRNRG